MDSNALCGPISKWTHAGALLSQVRIYESINFKEFVKLLSAFSARASKETKLQYMFLVYDVDGDGEG